MFTGLMSVWIAFSYLQNNNNNYYKNSSSSSSSSSGSSSSSKPNSKFKEIAVPFSKALVNSVFY